VRGAFEKILALVRAGKAVVSVHAQLRLEENRIDTAALVTSLADGAVIEDYPDYHAGPAVLVLSSLSGGEAVHSVWGIAKGTEEPAVLVTVYRPDPARWSSGFRRRSQ